MFNILFPLVHMHMGSDRWTPHHLSHTLSQILNKVGVYYECGVVVHGLLLNNKITQRNAHIAHNHNDGWLDGKTHHRQHDGATWHHEIKKKSFIFFRKKIESFIHSWISRKGGPHAKGLALYHGTLNIPFSDVNSENG